MRARLSILKTGLRIHIFFPLRLIFKEKICYNNN